MAATSNSVVTGIGGGGAVADEINDGETAAAPSQNAVFDALALKQSASDPTINPDRAYFFQTDFTDDDRATLTAASNAGGGAGAAVSSSSTGVNSTENCVGVMDLITGSGTTGRAGLISAGNLALGGVALKFGARVALSSVSNGTDTYTSYLGFIDNVGAGDQTDGVYFRYTHGTNSGRWEGVVADAGSRTASDAGVTPVDTENAVFEIEVNAAGTSAAFYINGTLRTTISTGLPGAGDLFVYGAKIEKSAGTNSRTMSLDWVYLKCTKSTSR